MLFSRSDIQYLAGYTAYSNLILPESGLAPYPTDWISKAGYPLSVRIFGTIFGVLPLKLQFHMAGYPASFISGRPLVLILSFTKEPILIKFYPKIQLFLLLFSGLTVPVCITYTYVANTNILSDLYMKCEHLLNSRFRPSQTTDLCNKHGETLFFSIYLFGLDHSSTKTPD